MRHTRDFLSAHKLILHRLTSQNCYYSLLTSVVHGSRKWAYVERFCEWRQSALSSSYSYCLNLDLLWLPPSFVNLLVTVAQFVVMVMASHSTLVLSYCYLSVINSALFHCDLVLACFFSKVKCVSGKTGLVRKIANFANWHKVRNYQYRNFQLISIKTLRCHIRVWKR